MMMVSRVAELTARGHCLQGGVSSGSCVVRVTMRMTVWRPMKEARQAQATPMSQLQHPDEEIQAARFHHFDHSLRPPRIVAIGPDPREERQLAFVDHDHLRLSLEIVHEVDHPQHPVLSSALSMMSEVYPQHLGRKREEADQHGV